MRTQRKFLAWMMTFFLLASVIPTAALADEAALPEIDTAWWTEKEEGQVEFVLSTPAQFAGLIYLSNTEELRNLGFKGCTIYLGDDLDMSPYSGTVTGNDGTYTFTATKAYTALGGGTIYYSNFVLDGRGHTIHNFCFSANPNYNNRTALICGMGAPGTVKNIRFDNCQAISSGYYMFNAIVVGQSRGTIEDVVVENCLVVGRSDYTGAIAGRNSGTIQNCVVSDTAIHAKSYTSAFAGVSSTDASSSTVVCRGNTATNVTITGTHYVGGIAGQISNVFNGGTVTIEDCFFSGDITATDQSGLIAGVVSSNAGEVVISNCTAVGTFSSTNPNTSGAIIGRGKGPNNPEIPSPDIRDCIAVLVPADKVGEIVETENGTVQFPSDSEIVLSASGTTVQLPEDKTGSITKDELILPPGSAITSADSTATLEYGGVMTTDNKVIGSSSDGTLPTINNDHSITIPAGGSYQGVEYPYGGIVYSDGTVVANAAPDPDTDPAPAPAYRDDDDDGYSVSVPSASSIKHGSITVSPRSAEKGDTVTITVKPDKGYELDDLTVTDKDGDAVKLTKKSDTKYTFTMPSGKVEVEATFVKIKEEVPQQTFTDVPNGYWAEDAIAWAYENGYMNGNTAVTFNPEGTVSRQQLWMILARLSGYNPATMAEAKSWAVDNGISDGTAPGGAVSRQQLVTILYRYAVRMGYQTDRTADLTVYPDHAGVAAYAKDAMSWSVANSIVGGTTQGTLNPSGTATRAQFAVILSRFCENIVG